MTKNYAISRLQSYKFNDVGGVLKEALRILPNYENPNCNPELSYLNVNLVDTDLCGLTPEKYILKYREDNGIKGRFNTGAKNKKSNTNCMVQALFTASNEYMAQLTREEQIEYFKDCLDFFKSEFPSVHIIAANCHFDEITPHLHISFIPVVSRVNSKSGELENIFSTSKLMPGRDFFPKYQDRFYKFISSKYDGLDRGHSERKNMSPQVFREYSRLRDELYEARQDVFNCKKTIYNQQQRISDLYTELARVKGDASVLESIPLVGLLVEVLREMREDDLERILHRFIKEAQYELEEQKLELIDKQTDCLSLNLQIKNANGRKKSFIQHYKDIQKDR